MNEEQISPVNLCQIPSGFTKSAAFYFQFLKLGTYNVWDREFHFMETIHNKLSKNTDNGFGQQVPFVMVQGQLMGELPELWLDQLLNLLSCVFPYKHSSALSKPVGTNGSAESSFKSWLFGYWFVTAETWDLTSLLSNSAAVSILTRFAHVSCHMMAYHMK